MERLIADACWLVQYLRIVNVERSVADAPFGCNSVFTLILWVGERVSE